MPEDYDAADPKHRPTPEQAGFVTKAILDHLIDGGSYRHLIYDRMGYGSDAYVTLQVAGALDISNLSPVKSPEELPKIIFAKLDKVASVDDHWVFFANGSRGHWHGNRAAAVGDTVLRLGIMRPGSLTWPVVPLDEPFEFDSFKDNS